MQERKYLNDEIITLNKEERKIFDDMLDIPEYEQLFLFLLQKGLLQLLLKQKIFLLLWQPRNEPVEGGNTLSVIRCRLVVQRRSRMGEQMNFPDSLRSTPVVRLQGEEGC